MAFARRDRPACREPPQWTAATRHCFDVSAFMEPRTRLVLATFVATVALGVGTGWAIGRKTLVHALPPQETVDPPPAPARPPPLSDETRALLTDLTASDVATWREAAVRLAFARPFPFAELAALVPSAPERVREVMDRAFSQCVTLEEFSQKRLVLLLDPSLDQAREQLRQGVLEYRGVGNGFGVAVSLQALRSRDVPQLARALRFLAVARVSCARDRVRGLVSNRALVGDVTMPMVRVGDVAEETLRSLPASLSPLSGLREALANTPLIDTVAEVVPTSVDAASVTEWFALARPVWRAWWALSGEGGRPSDEVWRARTNEFLHFSETRRLHPRGRSLLHVKGPSTVSCQAITGEGIVKWSVLPLELERDPVDDVVHLECHQSADQTVLDRKFPFEPGEELTIEVLWP
jgi:hypothetical protein